MYTWIQLIEKGARIPRTYFFLNKIPQLCIYNVFIFYYFCLYYLPSHSYFSFNLYFIIQSLSFVLHFFFEIAIRNYQGKTFSSHNVFRKVKMLNIHIIGLGSKFKGTRILPLNLKPQISHHRKLPFPKTKAFC